MNDTVSAYDLQRSAKIVAESIPEYRALQARLCGKPRNIRHGIANALLDWAYDPTIGMSAEEKRAFIERCKGELARRGEPID
jgi:hypothetical protein